MSISIKVSIRCRPFTVDDKLGVILNQNEEESGEVELINCEYSTTRFPFTYAWWSAYGYKRHLIGDEMQAADDMLLVNQEMAYEQVGRKIKHDLLTGNAVVLFAYGLSGSGKTYTVFGPDAVDAPEAWFKQKEPHPLWGIFPRLAYDLFQEKKDGWKITMKYFQNVVDTVRDLMSPSGEEQHYKNGMRKDPDGFMDIEWCGSRVLKSWHELREVFQIANGRKAIAPTQFNPMSTRGHCIMTLEVEMPNPEMQGMKQRGRVYVCDLAGTEPAGDIVFAQYSKVTFDDGSFEYKFDGPHPDPKKTKELQDQGKKINLSLSEMAQFFMKMAEAVKAKKLKPGMSIPGCNSFFLCKYLKDTMLQARTYLFCAIRPEVQFLKYTFATLGFAKNASVVKLAPKKAGAVAASANEKKLMAELDAMKMLVKQLQETMSSATQASGGSSNPDADRMIAELERKLQEKQQDLDSELLNGGDVGNSRQQEEDTRAQQQREEYARRGINLAAYDEESTTAPYFTNLDDDAFRSNRFMYILKKPVTVFGSKNDIQLMSLAVLHNHCSVRFDEAAGKVFITAGKGDTWRNGHQILEGAEEELSVLDRVAMGDQLMMFHWKALEAAAGTDLSPMSADDAVREYQDGLMQARAKGTQAVTNELNNEMQRILHEREKWEKEKSEIKVQRNEEEYQRAMTAVDNAILDLLPKAKEAKQTVDLLNRVKMSFDVVLEKGSESIPKVMISVEYGAHHDGGSVQIPGVGSAKAGLSILIEPQEFLPKLSLLKDEMMKLRSAIDAKRDYELPEQHDPLYLMFDNDFHLGTATHWPEYLLYNLETDEEERMQDIKNAAVPYNNVGLLEVRWIPLPGPPNEAGDIDMSVPVRDIDSEADLLGQPWTYRLEIKRAADLPVYCNLAYVSYDFFGEPFLTEAVQQTTHSPVFEYSKVHHVASVTQEFIDYLKGSIEMQIHVNQHVEPPADKIGTNNAIVVESILTGEAKGYAAAAAGGGGPGAVGLAALETRVSELQKELAAKTTENELLKNRVQMLETQLAQAQALVGATPKSRQSLSDAKMIDSIVNGEDEHKLS